MCHQLFVSLHYKNKRPMKIKLMTILLNAILVFEVGAIVIGIGMLIFG